MRKIQILKEHGISVKFEGDSTLALEVSYNPDTNEDFSKWIDVTNWTNKQVYEWLGY